MIDLDLWRTEEDQRNTLRHKEGLSIIVEGDEEEETAEFKVGQDGYQDAMEESKDKVILWENEDSQHPGEREDVEIHFVKNEREEPFFRYDLLDFDKEHHPKVHNAQGTPIERCGAGKTVMRQQDEEGISIKRRRKVIMKCEDEYLCVCQERQVNSGGEVHTSSIDASNDSYYDLSSVELAFTEGNRNEIRLRTVPAPEEGSQQVDLQFMIQRINWVEEQFVFISLGTSNLLQVKSNGDVITKAPRNEGQGACIDGEIGSHAYSDEYIFSRERQDRRSFAFKSILTGKYLSVDMFGRVSASSDDVGRAQQWQIIYINN